MNKNCHSASKKCHDSNPGHDDQIATDSNPESGPQHSHLPKNNRFPDGVFATLLPQLQRAVIDNGYFSPTPIQEKAIPPLIEGRDLLGCAQTGTGKTAAFTLPVLQYLAQNKRKTIPAHPRVLVLAPTRELASQIGDSISRYGCHLPTTHAVVFGGISQIPQVKKLRRGVDIVAATPGRLLDLIQQGHLYLDSIELFVLDEADRMLDMGFIRDIRKIIAKLPKKRQSLFFSATMSPEIINFSRALVSDPVHIAIAPEKPVGERIAQKVFFVGKKSKNSLLTSLLDDSRLDRVIVFTKMKYSANRVAQKLNASGVSAAAIHGNKSQGARTQALTGFKSGKVRILVATDVASRGLDVEMISHVINYDLPSEPETYIHRIGRTARAGSDGIALSFCSAEERDYLRSIESLLGKPVPTETDHAFHCKLACNAANGKARRSPNPKQGRRRNKELKTYAPHKKYRG